MGNLVPFDRKDSEFALTAETRRAVEKIRKECWAMGVRLGLNPGTREDLARYLARCQAIEDSKSRHPSNIERPHGN